MGGGSWKVAFADFMTAMFALFLLLWLVGLKPETKQGIENYFKTYSIFKNFSGVMKGQGSIMPNPPKEDPKTKSEAEGIKKKALTKPDNQKVIAEIKDKIAVELKEKADQIMIKEVNGKILVELVDKENRPIFNSGNMTMTAAGREALQIVAKMMIENNYKAAIEGHTDSKKFTSAYYTNWDLSTERALETKRILEGMGYSEKNIVSITGYADTRPLIKENPEDMKNRRISLILDWGEGSTKQVTTESSATQENTPPADNAEHSTTVQEEHTTGH